MCDLMKKWIVRQKLAMIAFANVPQCERIEHGAEVQRALAAAFECVRFVEAAVCDRVDDGRAGLKREREREQRERAERKRRRTMCR